MSSNAVGTERASTIVGYKIEKGNFSNNTPNLPQRVALLGEANEVNQSNFTANEAKQITSAQQAGELYGFGSPLYMAARILFPNSGSGIGGIPVFVYAQAEAGGASAKVFEITPVGTASKNTTHTIVVAGRSGVDGEIYDINIENGDTATEISAKIADALDNVLGCPFDGNDTTYSTILTSKWKGATAEDLTVTVNTNDDAAGLSYVVEDVQSGAGTPSIATALTNFGSAWNTVVLNTYGTVTSIMDALEADNGIPNPTTPTGRYSGEKMKPYIALTGSVVDDPSTITDARLNDVTIALCVAPLSPGHPLEAAANMAVLFGRLSQDNPHLDVMNLEYSDMPVPSDGIIGSMATYNNRDLFVKKGCSTVDFNNGVYQIKDFVTTYHPVGETPPQFRYCRNIMLDLNIAFGYRLLEDLNVVGKSIAGNDDLTTVSNVIKPKQWKQIVDAYANDLAERALIADPTFMQDSIAVDISTTNPDRLETTFKYKRTGTARIASTTATAGFNFGS
jgi:phage tail sheath gpL-like